MATDRVLSQSLLARRAPKLRGALTASLVGHALLLTAAVIYAKYGADRAIVDLDQKPIKATLVRRGKPRDEKMLPRKEELPPPPQKQEEAPAAPKPEAKPPEKPAVALPIPELKPTQAKAEKKPGEKEGVDRKKALFSAFDKASKKANPADELEGAEDGDELGDSAIQEGERYFGLLKAQVTRHFDLPQTIPDDERISLKALVTIRLARNGELVDAKITKASNNGLYDNAVLAALKRAQPFSPPPEHLREQLQRRGITMEFTP